jgi:tripartite-type tricarboxylate transporter receptor subunit TctC
MHSTRRLTLAALLCGVACTAAAQTAEARFPSKAVKIIVPFTAGGLADTLARGIAQELNAAWSQAVIVENRPGANTIIAAQATARSAPDGYTLLMANDPTLSSNQHLYAKLPYDPVNDLTPVVNVAETLEILVAGPAFKGRGLAELLAEAKAAPGEMNYGTYGPGSKAHLDAEAFAKATGTKFVHVPYKGVADVVPALLGGHIKIAFTGVPPVAPFVKAGQLQAIAIASPKRSALLPQVPTFAEAGLPNFNSSSWFGLVAPAGTPRAVIEKVARDVSAIITKPDFQARFITGVGLELVNQGPDQFAEFLKKDRAIYGVQIKEIGVKLD